MVGQPTPTKRECVNFSAMAMIDSRTISIHPQEHWSNVEAGQCREPSSRGRHCDLAMFAWCGNRNDRFVPLDQFALRKRSILALGGWCRKCTTTKNSHAQSDRN